MRFKELRSFSVLFAVTGESVEFELDLYRAQAVGGNVNVCQCYCGSLPGCGNMVDVARRRHRPRAQQAQAALSDVFRVLFNLVYGGGWARVWSWSIAWFER